MPDLIPLPKTPKSSVFKLVPNSHARVSKTNNATAIFDQEGAYFQHVIYDNDWTSIKNERLSVKSGYAWDGCTPKIHVFGLFTLGTPNGTFRLGKPWNYHASLVHDALCQFRHELPFTQRQVTQIFKEQLIESKWPFTKIYVKAVTCFGPQDFPHE